MKEVLCVVSLFLVLSNQCVASLIQKKSSYSCAASNNKATVTCGRTGEYIGVLKLFEQDGVEDTKTLAIFDITKNRTIGNVAIYHVKVKNNKMWCFDFAGERLKSYGFDEVPLLKNVISSLMVLAKPSLRVSTNRVNGTLKICSIGVDKNYESEFYLFVGDSKKIVYLAKTPSLWSESLNPILNNVVDKTSQIVKRDSYFFVDINEKNVIKILDLTKKGGFPYLLILGPTWAKTMGSYQINTENYPHGIEGLIGVSKLASQRNIKIGLHVLTALVSKNDPLAAPLPDLGLLKKNGILVEKYGYYLVDLKGSLKYQIADRIANVMNQTHAGMIYFDGGEASSSSIAANAEYDIAEQQIEVLKRLQEPTLVQGSGNTSRLWPYLSRMAADDFAVLAPVEYLDFYKIAQKLPSYDNNLMPAELGWIGLLAETPSYPATNPEDISTHMARALAFNLPFSIETDEANLDANPYTQKLFSILGVTNRVLQAGGVSASARKALKTGYWYYVDDSRPHFSKLNLKKIFEDKNIIDLGLMTEKASGIMLRISNIRLRNNDNIFKVLNGVEIEEEYIDDFNRGLLMERIRFNGEKKENSAIDMTQFREMHVKYFLKLADNNKTAACSVLNLQLEDVDGFFRDYYLRAIPNKESTAMINYLDAPPQMLTGLMPAYMAYPMKSAIYHFNYSKVVAMNIRWMKTCNVHEKILLKHISMVQEDSAILNSIELFVGVKKVLDIPLLKTGEILDVFPNGDVTICKRAICQKVANILSALPKNIGNQHIYIKTKGNAIYDLTFGELTSKIRLQ